jgi:hypothetical protein
VSDMHRTRRLGRRVQGSRTVSYLAPPPTGHQRSKQRSGLKRVREETERVDQAIHTTIGRNDDTADGVRSRVRAKTNRVIGIIRGLRVALDSVMAAR